LISKKFLALLALLAAAACVVAAVAPRAFASQACVPGSNATGPGGTVQHANLPGGQLWAGTVKAAVDGTGTAVETYCVDIHNRLCKGQCYDQAPDVTAPEVVWILDNNYPKVPSQPASLANPNKRSRAVQLAVWHFTDGLDISSGGSPADVFDAARALVAAAAAAAVPRTPTALYLAPAASNGVAGQLHTLAATLLDQNGAPLAGVTVSFTVTGVNPAAGDIVTEPNGIASFSYVGATPGADAIEATVDYTIPVGLRWHLGDCQRLIMGQAAPGRLTAAAVRTWDGSVAVTPATWGRVKRTYR
jgi:TQXA domain-containing protein